MTFVETDLFAGERRDGAHAGADALFGELAEDAHEPLEAGRVFGRERRRLHAREADGERTPIEPDGAVSADHRFNRDGAGTGEWIKDELIRVREVFNDALRERGVHARGIAMKGMGEAIRALGRGAFEGFA